MGDRKKKRGRWAYLDQFQPNLAGEMIYTGSSYRSLLQEEARRRRYLLLGLEGAAMLALILVGGCISAPGVGRCPYVLLPYVGQLAAGVSLCWALGQLLTGGRTLREYVYQATVEKVPLRSGITMVCSGLSMIGEIVYLLLHREEGGLLRGLGFLGLTAGAVALTMHLKVLVKNLKWEKLNRDSCGK